MATPPKTQPVDPGMHKRIMRMAALVNTSYSCPRMGYTAPLKQKPKKGVNNV